ncbi:MAG TPA: SUMF1/EgtB/PvdO family nonheme iron enzyme [Bryobacteraceae bacterium]|nr:SUMF1/EgtB/PvdO family nonheme iron enzyme [Bryobacteraceae bacterium]
MYHDAFRVVNAHSAPVSVPPGKEVTQEAYERVTKNNPSTFPGPKRPLENISYNQAQTFCAAVGMRLPVEPEWEYAARARTTARSYSSELIGLENRPQPASGFRCVDDCTGGRQSRVSFADLAAREGAGAFDWIAIKQHERITDGERMVRRICEA